MEPMMLSPIIYSPVGEIEDLVSHDVYKKRRDTMIHTVAKTRKGFENTKWNIRQNFSCRI